MLDESEATEIQKPTQTKKRKKLRKNYQTINEKIN